MTFARHGYVGVFYTVKYNQAFQLLTFNADFFCYNCYHALTFRGCQTPEKKNWFCLGTVKLTNAMLGVRDIGLVFIREVLVYEESGAGSMTDTTSPDSEVSCSILSYGLYN